MAVVPPVEAEVMAAELVERAGDRTKLEVDRLCCAVVEESEPDVIEELSTVD